MKVGYDATYLEVGSTGMSRVCYEYLKSFFRLAKERDIEIELITYNGKIRPEYNTFDLPIVKLGYCKSYYLYANTIFSFWINTSKELKNRYDVIFWMTFDNFGCNLKHTEQFALVHDLAALRLSKSYPMKRIVQQYLSMFKIKYSKCHLISISNSTKMDIEKLFKIQDVNVIYNGVNESKYYSSKNTNMILNKYNLREVQYVIFSGIISYRKNLIDLLKAIEIVNKRRTLDNNIHLVITGNREDITKAYINRYAPSVLKYCHPLGWLPDEELFVVYRNAKCLVYPSMYEGFGLPILEAQRQQIPVITANASCLPEIAGEGAMYFNVGNYQQLSDCIEKISNSDVRNDLILKGNENLLRFSWDTSANRIIDLFEKTINLNKNVE